MTIPKCIEYRDDANCRIAFNTDNIVKIEESSDKATTFIYCTDGKWYIIRETYDKVLNDYVSAK